MHDPSLLFILLVEEVFISLVLSIKSMVSISGRLSPHSLEMFSISPLQAYSFRCWFSNNSVITFLEGCFPSSFVAEVGIFFSILLFQWSIFYSFFRRHCDVALFTHHLELWGSCSFHAYPFNRSVVSSAQVLFILSSCLSLVNRSAVRICSSLLLFSNGAFSTLFTFVRGGHSVETENSVYTIRFILKFGFEN